MEIFLQLQYLCLLYSKFIYLFTCLSPMLSKKCPETDTIKDTTICFNDLLHLMLEICLWFLVCITFLPLIHPVSVSWHWYIPCLKSSYYQMHAVSQPSTICNYNTCYPSSFPNRLCSLNPSLDHDPLIIPKAKKIIINVIASHDMYIPFRFLVF